MGLGSEAGEEGGDAVYDAEEVGVHYLLTPIESVSRPTIGRAQLTRGVAYCMKIFHIIPPTLYPNARIQHKEINLAEIHLHLRP